MKHFNATLLLLCFGFFAYPQNNLNGINTDSLKLHHVALHQGLLVFEGNTQSYAELPGAADLESEKGSWCFTLNIKRASTGAGQSILSKTEAIGSYSGINLFEDSGRIALQIKNNTNKETLTIKSEYLAGTGPHAIVITYENNVSLKLFIDGQLKTESKAPYFIFSRNPLRLGCSMDSYWKPFSGELGELQIIPQVLSPDEIARRFIEEKINVKEFKIYPNPASKQLMIELPTTDNFSLRLMDANGKLVYSEKVNAIKNLIINTESFAAGIYYLHLSGSNNSHPEEIRKLLITKD